MVGVTRRKHIIDMQAREAKKEDHMESHRVYICSLHYPLFHYALFVTRLLFVLTYRFRPLHPCHSLHLLNLARFIPLPRFHSTLDQSHNKKQLAVSSHFDLCTI